MLVLVHIELSLSYKFLAQIHRQLKGSVLTDVVLVNVVIGVQDELPHFFDVLFVNQPVHDYSKIIGSFWVVTMDHEVELASLEGESLAATGWNCLFFAGLKFTACCIKSIVPLKIEKLYWVEVGGCVRLGVSLVMMICM